MNKYNILRSLLLLLLLVLSIIQVEAQTAFPAFGATDNDFNNPANWTNGLPGPGNDATIVGASTAVINSPTTLNFNITIFFGSGIEINAAVVNSGTISNQSGFFTVTSNGSIENSGSIININQAAVVIDGDVDNLAIGIFRADRTSDVTLGATANFTNAGTVLAESGSRNIQGTDCFEANGAGKFFTNNGILTNQGTFNANGKVRNAGTFTNDFTGSLTLPSCSLFENLANALFDNKGEVTHGAEFFINDGTVQNSGTFNSNKPFTNNSIIENLAGGNFVVGLTLTNNGSLTNQVGGTLNLWFQIDNNSAISNFGTINVPTGGTLNNLAGTITNQVGGNITTQTPAVLILVNDAAFQNLGTIGDELRLVANTGSTFANSGIINTGASFTNQGGSIQNSGTLNVNPITGDIFNNTGSFFNTSTGIINGGAGIEIENRATFTNDGTLQGDNKIRNLGATTLFTNNGLIVTTVNGEVINEGTFANNGEVQNMADINNTGTWTNQGTLTDNSGGNFDNNGILENLSGGVIQNDFEIQNNSILNNAAGGTITNGVRLFNNGTINNDGNLVNIGLFTNDSQLTNNGMIDNNNGGVITNNGIIDNNNVFNNSVGSFVVNNNTLNNVGTFTNNGVFSEQGTSTGNSFAGTTGTIVLDPSNAGLADDLTLDISFGGQASILGSSISGASLGFVTANTLSLIDPSGMEVNSFVYDCSNVGANTIGFKVINQAGDEFLSAATITITKIQGPIYSNCDASTIFVNADQNGVAAVNWEVPVVEPDASGAVTVAETNGFEPGNTFPLGNTTIEYIATDCAGNTAVCSFTITVLPFDPCAADTELPVLNNCPNNIAIEAGADGTALVSWVPPTVTDNNPDATVVSTANPGDVFSIGTTTVSYTATDCGGNQVSCSFDIIVTAPSGSDQTCDNVIEVRDVVNTKLDCGDGTKYVVWLQGGITYKAGSDLVFAQFADGTARLKGSITGEGGTGSVDVTFTGFTSNDPVGSPKSNSCVNNTGADFTYYTAFSGTVTRANGTALQITRKGEAFQIGVGANLQDDNKLGASGWFYSAGGPDGDFNFRIGSHVPCDNNFFDGTPDCSNQHILFVVGNEYHLNSSDQVIKERLESQGYSVTVEDDNDVRTSHADGKGLVLISSTISSYNVGAKFTYSDVPVITWESWLYDDLKMTDDDTNSDYGIEDGVSNAKILSSNNPLAAGLSGTKRVFNSNRSIRYGDPSSGNGGLIEIAAVPGENDHLMIFAYEKGGAMDDNFAAPNKRLGFFLEDNTAIDLTNDGWALFDAAIDWATGCNAGGDSNDDGGNGDDDDDDEDDDDCELDVLFVVGNASSLGFGDQAVKNLLEEGDLSVELVDDDQVSSSNANGKELIIISSTISSSKVNTKFRNTAVPVMTWEPWLYDDMKMTGTSTNVDYGSYGNVDQTKIRTQGHPLAAGLSNEPIVLNGNYEVSFGKPSQTNPDLIQIGSILGQDHNLMIFGYDKGGSMEGGFTAPERRLGFFLRDHTAAYLNTNGKALFYAAISWLANCQSIETLSQAAGFANIMENVDEKNESARFSKQEFKIFPNPATHLIRLDLTKVQSKSMTLVVTDVRGQVKILQEVEGFDQGVYTLHLNDLPSGMYSVQVRTKERVLPAKQFVISK